MNHKFTAGVGALALSVCAAFSAWIMPVLGAENIDVIFTDVTDTDLTTLSGEAKIMVSVSGAQGNASIAQMALGFTGDLEYKSIQFLEGENNPPECFQYSPNAALVNSSNELMPSIISSSSIPFEEQTDLFILTFEGEAGDSVTLNIADLENTYCTVDGVDLMPAEDESITVTASSESNEGKTATLQLTMDRVTDFAAGGSSGYNGSGIEVRITSEDTPGYTIYTILNNTLVSNGGHRESESIPTFTVENTVLADDTYTVEISGIGYIPYVRSGVTFDEVLEITNADFVPGDINADGVVDITDKEECEKAVADAEYAEGLAGAADFNRDGVVDRYDLVIFDDITAPEGAPEKMDAPSVTGGSRRITVSWTAPEDNGEEITGYIIRYGTSEDDLDETEEITDASSTSETITGLSAGTRYYVSIAATNAAGTGEFSDTANARTDSESSPGGGGGGTGGGNTGGGNTGGGGNPSITFPTATATPAPSSSDKVFTDLGNHEWAKDSIYRLKDAGIIGGVSETEYAPANNIKRGDFILILTRMLGIDDEFTENFADVPENSYYYDAIGSARAAGIATGDGENFMPENSITRQDLITLAYRAFLNAGYIEATEDFTSLDVFADRDSISDYAAAPMASMVQSGIIQGSDGNVNPLGSATRAEVAVMCARLLDLMQ